MQTRVSPRNSESIPAQNIGILPPNILSEENKYSLNANLPVYDSFGPQGHNEQVVPEPVQQNLPKLSPLEQMLLKQQGQIAPPTYQQPVNDQSHHSNYNNQNN